MTEAVEYFFFSLLNRVARVLPFRIAGTIGACLGGGTFLLTSFRKAITLDNIAKAFPDLTSEEIRRIARGAYRNYGISLVEMLWSGGQSRERLKRVVTVDNPDVLEQALAEGKGVIVLSGHFGSWEFLIPALNLHTGRQVASVVQHQRNQKIDRLINAQRQRFGNLTIPMGISARKIIDVLNNRNIVAMLGDQSGPRESIFIDFLGRPAATHRGGAAFSLKTGAPLVMGFLIRRNGGGYRFVFERVDKSGLEEYTEENIIELTKRHTAILERFIRMYPDHWLWMHKRWKHTKYFESRQRNIAESA